MSKLTKFEKFHGQISKLSKQYYILKVEKDLEYIILGVKIFIKEQRELNGNIFQPVIRSIERQLPVFFVIVNRDKNLKDKEKANIENLALNFPMLRLEKEAFNLCAEQLQPRLDDFVAEAFQLRY